MLDKHHAGVILLLLSDVPVHCTDCSRDIKAGDYEGHDHGRPQLFWKGGARIGQGGAT